MSDNRLTIEVDQLQVTLEGDCDSIAEAYEAMRAVIVDHLEESLDEGELPPGENRPPDDRPPAGSSTDNQTEPQFNVDAVEQQLAAGKELAEVQLQLVVCTDLYYRVAALARDDFRDSIFGTIIEPDGLDSVFFSQEAARQMSDELEFGTTLWRQLTEAGKAAVHGDSS